MIESSNIQLNPRFSKSKYIQSQKYKNTRIRNPIECQIAKKPECYKAWKTESKKLRISEMLNTF